MSKAHYFYLKMPVTELEKLVDKHLESFEILLKDSFSDEELTPHEKMLDSMAAVFAQPIISELSFEDFYTNENQAEKQRAFFESAKSSISLENMPYWQSNPFQVTYLIDLVSKFDEILIDTGGVNELMFKEDYLKELAKYKAIDSLYTEKVEKKIEVKTSRPVDPIDFTILDVYKQIERLKEEQKLETIDIPSEKRMAIFTVMKNEKNLNAQALLIKSGLIAKDFGDNLESLKFFLKKI